MNARNHNLNRLVNKARLIGNLSKKAEANRGFANISKNDEHFNYMIKEQVKKSSMILGLKDRERVKLTKAVTVSVIPHLEIFHN